MNNINTQETFLNLKKKAYENIILKGLLYNKGTLFNCHSCYVHRRDSVKTNKWC